MGIRNFSPQLRNSAILRTTKSIAELRTKKSCGTAIADLQNLTSPIPQLSAISGQFPYFTVPCPRLRMLQQSTKNNVYNVSKEIKKTCVKGTAARDFWPAIFFPWIDPIWMPDSYPKFGVLRFEAELENLLVYDSGVHMGWFTKKQRPKISCYCPFNILSITKKTWW